MKMGTLPRGAKILPVEKNGQKPHIIVRDSELKHCAYCDQWLPLSSYWSNANHWDGLQCHCKNCVVEQIIETHRRHGK